MQQITYFDGPINVTNVKRRKKASILLVKSV